MKDLLDAPLPREVPHPPPSARLIWLTIATAVVSLIWSFAPRWLNYSVRPARMGFLFIAGLVLLYPLFWAMARAINSRQRKALLPLGLFLLGIAQVVLGEQHFLTEIWLPRHQDGVGDLMLVAIVLLLADRWLHLRPSSMRWKGVQYWMYAYLAQWTVWMLLVGMHMVVPGAENKIALALGVPLLVSLGCLATLQPAYAAAASSRERLETGLLWGSMVLLLAGLTASYLGFMEFAFLLQGDDLQTIPEPTTWAIWSDYLWAAGWGLLLLLSVFSGARWFFKWVQTP